MSQPESSASNPSEVGSGRGEANLHGGGADDNFSEKDNALVRTCQGEESNPGATTALRESCESPDGRTSDDLCMDVGPVPREWQSFEDVSFCASQLSERD